MRNIDKNEIIGEVAKLHRAGGDVDLLLALLREKGFNQIDSILALRKVVGLSLADAKDMVDASKVWSDQYEKVQALREVALNALKALSKE